mgnify:CR=1 FL=1
MRALVVEQLLADYAGVHIRDVPTPQPGPGEVRIKVRAAAVNFPDLMQTRGEHQHKPPIPFVGGMELAGEVDALGEGVTGFTVGDAVVSGGRGGFAEYAILPALTLRRKPANLGFSDDGDNLIVIPIPKSGYEFEWDGTNEKIKVLAAIKKYSAALNPASMLTDAVSSLAVTVTGVAATDICLAVQAAAALEAGLVIQSARVTGVDTVTVELLNTSAGTVDGASATADFYVLKANGQMQEVPAATDLSALTDVQLLVFGRKPA